MQLLLPLLFSIFCSLFCVRLAKDQRQSPYLWGAIGALLGLMGVALCYFRMRQVQRTAEKQRRKERSLPRVSLWESDFWYYLDSQGETCGPLSLRKLQSRARQGKVSRSTYVWCEKMEQWERIDNLNGLGEEIFQPKAIQI